jgi:hypothetical protein
MPPRHVYWTIILEGQPTAFRARTREELLPTLRQLHSRHPDAVLMWFARGRLWQSQEEEREARTQRRQPAERRAPQWRPGGLHRDPRDRFKRPRAEKRRKFAAERRRARGGIKDDSRPDERGPDAQPRPRSQRPPSGSRRRPGRGRQGPGRGRGGTGGGGSPR